MKYSKIAKSSLGSNDLKVCDILCVTTTHCSVFLREGKVFCGVCDFGLQSSGNFYLI